jgi:hypothetical protein
LTKGLFTNYMLRKDGGDGLKDDFKFAKVGGRGGEKDIIGIKMRGGENRCFEGECGESGSALEIAEKDGIKDRRKDLIELGVHIIDGGVGGLTDGYSEEIGNEAGKGWVSNRIQGTGE